MYVHDMAIRGATLSWGIRVCSPPALYLVAAKREIETAGVRCHIVPGTENSVHQYISIKDLFRTLIISAHDPRLMLRTFDIAIIVVESGCARLTEYRSAPFDVHPNHTGVPPHIAISGLVHEARGWLTLDCKGAPPRARSLHPSYPPRARLAPRRLSPPELSTYRLSDSQDNAPLHDMSWAAYPGDGMGEIGWQYRCSLSRKGVNLSDNASAICTYVCYRSAPYTIRDDPSSHESQCRACWSSMVVVDHR